MTLGVLSIRPIKLGDDDFGGVGFMRRNGNQVVLSVFPQEEQLTDQEKVSGSIPLERLDANKRLAYIQALHYFEPRMSEFDFLAIYLAIAGIEPILELFQREEKLFSKTLFLTSEWAFDDNIALLTLTGLVGATIYSTAQEGSAEVFGEIVKGVLEGRHPSSILKSLDDGLCCRSALIR